MTSPHASEEISSQNGAGGGGLAVRLAQIGAHQLSWDEYVAMVDLLDQTRR